MDMRTLALVVIASAFALACNIAGANVQGNGKARTEQRTVPAFKGLSVSGAVEIQVSVGGPQSVALTGDDNVLPIIRTRVANGTLVVDSKKSYSTTTPLVLRITTPSLEALSSSGACSGFVKGIGGGRFTVSASGASDFELAGTADQVAIDVSGAGEIHARQLRASTVSASSSGSGAIEVTATGSLAANVSGAGTIDYWGNPQSVARDISGAGSITSH